MYSNRSDGISCGQTIGILKTVDGDQSAFRGPASARGKSLQLAKKIVRIIREPLCFFASEHSRACSVTAVNSARVRVYLYIRLYRRHSKPQIYVYGATPVGVRWGGASGKTLGVYRDRG